MRPLMSCSVAKLALPMTRLSIIRPATATATGAASSASLVLPSCASCSAPASASRRKSFGYAGPRSRIRRSFARRSAMIWFSLCRAASSLMDSGQLQRRSDSGDAFEVAIIMQQGDALLDCDLRNEAIIGGANGEPLAPALEVQPRRILVACHWVDRVEKTLSRKEHAEIAEGFFGVRTLEDLLVNHRGETCCYTAVQELAQPRNCVGRASANEIDPHRRVDEDHSSSLASAQCLVIIVVADTATSKQLSQVLSLPRGDVLTQSQVDEFALGLDRRVAKCLLHQTVIENNISTHHTPPRCIIRCIRTRGKAHRYTPCFRLAAMKSSRSPSSTACVLPTSTLVRRSLMRDWSSTYERI